MRNAMLGVAVLGIVFACGTAIGQDDAPLSMYENMKGLDDFVGDWVGKGTVPEQFEDLAGKEYAIRSSIRWALNKSVLEHNWKLRIDESVVVEGKVLWSFDLEEKTIKTYTVASGGAYTHGTMRKDGDRWVAQSTGVNHEGKKTESAIVHTMSGRDTFIWESKDVVVDGQPQPGTQVEYKRVKRRAGRQPKATHQKWLRYIQGEWAYEWTSEEGDFNETGQSRVLPAAKGRAVLTHVTTGAGDREVEVGGWQSKEKAIVFTGFSSNRGYWHVTYTDIQEGKLSGPGYGVLPDGKAWKSTFTLTKKDDDTFEIRTVGTADGEKLVCLAKFARQK